MRDIKSAEEKLLDLIRKSGEIFGRHPLSQKNMILRVLSYLKRIISIPLQADLLSRIVVFLFFVSAALLLLFYISPLLPVDIGAQAPENGVNLAWTAAEGLSAHPLESYLQDIYKKDAFGLSVSKEGKTQDVSVDAVKDIMLAGILIEDPPQAIIKEKKSGNTYYLKKGESLGEIKIVDILEGKIVVEYRGEAYEIYL